MQPRRIIILRHGQSASNANGFAITTTIPNHLIDLTDFGEEQAYKLGIELKKIIGNKSLYFYVSPYLRAIKTYEQIIKSFSDNLITTRQDVRLRELDSVIQHSRAMLKSEIKNKNEFGNFYYRPTKGESLTDLFDRVDSFVCSMFRDFDDKSYPDNAIIVCHSFTIRIFLMRWFHLTVEQFESLQRPRNCDKYIFETNEEGKYILTTPFFNRKGQNIL